MYNQFGALLLATSLCCFADSATVQRSGPDTSEAAARTALAVLGLAATPNETLSSFSFFRTNGETTNLESTQFLWGGTPFDSNVFLEGLVAFQNYNPSVIFSEITPSIDLDVKWASVAATLGVGWDFPLADDWTLRPVAHVSLGHVSAEADLIGFPSLPTDLDAERAVDGSLNSLGIGGSLSVLRETELGAWDVEYRLRQTYFQFYPISESKAGNAKATSNQTSLFARHRLPIENIQFLNFPTKLILDTGLVLYHGDGAKVLRTDWLV